MKYTPELQTAILNLKLSKSFYLQIKNQTFRATVPTGRKFHRIRLHDADDIYDIALLEQSCSCMSSRRKCAHVLAFNRYVLRAYRLEAYLESGGLTRHPADLEAGKFHRIERELLQC